MQKKFRGKSTSKTLDGAFANLGRILLNSAEVGAKKAGECANDELASETSEEDGSEK